MGRNAVDANTVSSIPPPPPGFVIDPATVPPPPPGFVLDAPAEPAVAPDALNYDIPPVDESTVYATPAERQLTVPEALSYGSQAGLRGVADLLGSVYDVPNAVFMGTQWLANTADTALTGAPDVPSVGLGEALGGLFGADISGPPANLSDAIASTASDVATAAGVPPTAPEDMGGMEPFYDPIRFAAGSAGGGGLLSELARGAKTRLDDTGQRMLGDSLLRPYMDRPAAAITRDAGAGAGAAAGKDMVPEDTGPIASLLAALAGGVGGQALVASAQNIPRGILNAVDKLRPASRQVPVDPETRAPFSKAQENLAAAELQRRTGDRLPDVRGNVDENFGELQQLGIPPEAMPTFGLLTEDPGLIQIERGYRTDLPDQFIQRDQGMRDFSADKIGGMRDPAADQGAVARAAEGARLERLAPFSQGVDQAQGAADDIAAGLTRESAGYEPFRSRPEHYRTEASRNLDDVIVNEAYIPARQRKNELYDNIDPDRSEFVSIEPLRGRLQQIRNQVNEFGPEALSLPVNFVERIQNVLNRAAPDEDMMASVGELADLRKYLSTARSNARKGGNMDLADNLGAIQTQIDDIIGDHPAAAEANRNYRDNFAPTFRPGPGDEAAKFTRQIDREPFDDQGNPTRTQTPPERTADRFLSAPEKAAAVDRMIQAAENPARGRQAVRDYFMSDFAGSAFNSDGTLNPQRARAWLNQNEPVLEQFPDLLRDFEQRVARAGALRQSAVEADAALTAARNRLDEEGRSIERGAIGTLLRKDPKTVAQGILGRQNYEADRTLAEVDRAIGDDVTARAGWQDAVLEVLQDKVTTSARAGDNDFEVSMAALSKEFKANEDILGRVLDPEDMNTLQQVNTLLGYFRGLGKKATPGSDTASLLKAPDIFGDGAGLLGKTAQITVRHIYGDLRGGGILRRFKLMQAVMPTARDGANQIAYMAQFNPELGRYLLGLPVRDMKRIPTNWGLRAAIAADIANERDNTSEEE